MLCDKNGNEIKKRTLDEVMHVLTRKFNLYSGTKMLLEGWKLGGDANCIKLTKGAQEIVFDIKIPTLKGMVFVLYHHRELGGAATDAGAIMSVTKAHSLILHGNEDQTRATAKVLGWKLTAGSMGACKVRTEAKAKQKNVPTESEHVLSAKNGERWFTDIALVK